MDRCETEWKHFSLRKWSKSESEWKVVVRRAVGNDPPSHEPARQPEWRPQDFKMGRIRNCSYAFRFQYPRPDPFAASAFGLLDARGSLRLVIDAVHEDDALCLALTCRPLRNALWVRFPRRPAGDAHAGKRLRTRDAAVVARVPRLIWARGLDQPWPEPREDWQYVDFRGVPQELWPMNSFGTYQYITVITGTSWHKEPWPKICETAARHGALASLQWARGNLPDDIHISVNYEAAQGGHLHVLQWAWANGFAGHTSTAVAAAAGGHLAVLEWAHALQDWGNQAGVDACDWGNFVCRAAAGGGHLAVLQWARANGCPWDAATCMAAAEGGHLAVLQWARANGCPWHKAACLLISENHADTIIGRWIADQSEGP
jgi:hypothetical protein